MTDEHKSGKGNNVSEERRFISYFQKVTTIGIINTAKTLDEAGIKAREEIRDVGNLHKCYYTETKYQLNHIEPYQPDVEITLKDPSGENLQFAVDLSEKVRMAIAIALGKTVSELTEYDFQIFMKRAISDAVGTEETA